MTAPAEINELPELKYEFQPVDENGIKLGNKQVIKYRTQEELVEKLTTQNMLVIRQLREVNKKNRLGILEKEDIPETVSRFPAPVELHPTELTADEKITLARDLTDPEKMEEAFKRLTTAQFGAEPAKISTALTTSQKKEFDSQVRQEVSFFLANTPEYYPCQENLDTIYNWMVRYNLEPTRENFTMAFGRLNAAGILLQGGGTSEVPVEPVVEPVAVTEGPDTYIPQVPISPVTVAEVPPPAPASKVQRVSTGLSGTSSSTGGVPVTPGSDITYTIPAVVDKQKDGTSVLRRQAVTATGLKAIDAMPPEEYRRRFNTEPGFKEKVDALEKTRKVNPNQR